MSPFVLLLCFATILNLEPSYAKVWEYTLPEILQDCYDRVKDTKVNEFVGSVYGWLCEQHSIRNDSVQLRTFNVDTNTASYIIKLTNEAFGIGKSKSKRQAPLPPCVRREYRMLTATQRQRFHNAVNALKRDTSVRPNRYDAIAGIHTGTTNLRAHGGPAFLSWHRLYLRVFETALRQVDPSVCLAYWDSSLDDQLPNPVLSSIWTPEFLGTPQGPVTEGPCAGWRLPNRGSLIRNAGADGDLMTTQFINDLLTRRRYEDVVTSQIPLPQSYDLELQHGTVHMYVGGTMSQLNTAAYDLAFFLHHTFIDYLFQRFRNRLRSVNVDPSIYPNVPTNTRHLASSPSGFGTFNQAEGYSNALENYASYEPVPTCNATSPSCGGRFLTCQRGLCLPTTRSTTTGRKKRSTYIDDFLENCQGSSSLDVPVQNDYCVDDDCDTDNWAFLPVKIFNVRPPKFNTYQSFPVRAGRVDKNLDIYAPAAYNETKRYIFDRKSDPLTYNRCKKDTPSGQVFVYSHGLNYVGRYKEYAIVDQRQPVSMSVGYVGVKRPVGKEIVTAYIRAHDACGRVCRVACKDPGRDDYTECSGAVAISNERPLMYGTDYDDAVMDVFNYRSGNAFPNMENSNILVGVFCDYGKTFPYCSTGPKTSDYQEDRLVRILG